MHQLLTNSVKRRVNVSLFLQAVMRRFQVIPPQNDETVPGHISLSYTTIVSLPNLPPLPPCLLLTLRLFQSRLLVPTVFRLPNPGIPAPSIQTVSCKGTFNHYNERIVT